MKVASLFLADGARVESGKLYVFGGAWDRISVSNLPATHPTLAVVLIIEVGYDEALEQHTGELALMKDGRPAGPTLAFGFNVGHSPGLARGAPSFVPFTFTHNMLELPETGRYEWVISVDGEPGGHHAMEVTRINPPGMSSPS